MITFKENNMKAREITRAEGELAPWWATKYFIDMFDNPVFLRDCDANSYGNLNLDFIEIKEVPDYLGDAIRNSTENNND